MKTNSLNRKSNYRSAGFTLIELLISWARLGVLAGAIVPGYSKLVASNRAASGAFNFAGALQFARFQSVCSRQSKYGNYANTNRTVENY